MTNRSHLDYEVTWKDSLPAVLPWMEKCMFTPAMTIPLSHTLLITVTEEKEQLALPKGNISIELATKIGAQCKILGWSGSKGSQIIVIDDRPMILVSISKIKTTSIQKARQAGLDGAAALSSINISNLCIVGSGDLSPADVLDGFLQGLYSPAGFKKTKSTIPKNWPGAVSLLGVNHSEIQTALRLSRATLIARHLQDAPPNWLTPKKFGEVAKSLGSEFGIKVSLKGQEEMQALGMGALLGVASGSVNEPQLISMELDGEDQSRTLALIGKGLTFDSGGISLKPADGMDEMKFDMSGGAAVLGAMIALSRQKLPIRTVGLIGAVENMPGHTALKPGDILKTMSGKTIEVLNTDAEGRLVLADVMEYAKVHYKPSLMIDVATLTGAIIVALGKSGAGVMSNHEFAEKFVVATSQKCGEPSWALPLWPELDIEVTSEIADLKNITSSSVKAGALTAGAFLSQFAEQTPWVHIDIAGTGWNAKITGSPTKGGSGFGVRTLARICQDVLSFLNKSGT
ncbi:MAG: leucyl aminopeptidase [Pseudomonadota bacterium]